MAKDKISGYMRMPFSFISVVLESHGNYMLNGIDIR